MAICGRLSWVRRFAYVFTVLFFLPNFIAFCTPNWLASDQRIYGAVFLKLGLWEACFRSWINPEDLAYTKYFAGCRWIFTSEYQTLRSYLEPPFFIAVQVFFTIGFTLLLIACALILALHLCFSSQKEVSALCMIGALLIASALCCSIAVIIFGARGDGEDWMPDPAHNYLSWSFALGVIGTFFEYIAAVLFFIESRLARKRADERDHQVMFRSEQTHTKV